MVPRKSRLLIAAVGSLLGVAMMLAVTSTAAAATPRRQGSLVASAPKPAPAGIVITGQDLSEPLKLQAETNPAAVSAVVDQVSWFGRSLPTGTPKPADLGPKYTVVVLAGDVAKQSYDLYPLAKGGPLAYRPAKQPDLRKTTAAWFLGRLSMPETLRAAGVPLPKQMDPVTGGIGGGERVIPEEAINPAKGFGDMFGELRQVLLLNLAVIVVITSGLAGIALLTRRRTR